MDNLRGRLIEPSHEEYDEARALYNGMIDKRPAMIAQCVDVADVMACVNHAHESDTLVAIRGGGHNGGGLASCDGGLMIDLSHMRGVRVDPGSKTVRVEGGCTWGDVDHATHAFGMATPTGVISTTGVGGLTLGGGLGHLTRKCGLTIDNLLEADMVLADGSFVTVNSEQNEDLYWAIRGGGGNFGVVTSFVFQLHDIHTNYAGPMFWDLEQTPEILKFYRDFIRQAPDEINGFFAFLTVPPAPPFPEELHLRKMCGIVWCCTCPPEEGTKAIEPMREVARPAFEHVGPMPHPALQTMFDALYPKGLQWYWKADFVKEISDDAVELHQKFGAGLPTMHSTMHLYPIDGAAHRVAPDATPWAYRDANWAQVMVGVDPDPANNEKMTAWTREYWDALHPHSAGGAYVNFMFHDEGQDRVRATYGNNYERLVKIKTKYDPTNFFRVNQNIKPA
jgi:FAD/FMN-containing dehydrogenase